MAQVKKFNVGGAVQKMKYGNVIKNGITYQMNDESMKRLEQYIAEADADVQQSLASDWQLLTEGKDVYIDTMKNRRSTKPSDFTEGQMKRLNKDKPKEGLWHAMVNSDIHKFNRATEYFGKFDFTADDSKPVNEKSKFTKSNKKIEYRLDAEIVRRSRISF